MTKKEKDTRNVYGRHEIFQPGFEFKPEDLVATTKDEAGLRRWVTDLTGGEFTKGSGRLVRSPHCCCVLGVEIWPKIERKEAQLSSRMTTDRHPITWQPRGVRTEWHFLVPVKNKPDTWRQAICALPYPLTERDPIYEDSICIVGFRLLNPLRRDDLPESYGCMSGFNDYLDLTFQEMASIIERTFISNDTRRTLSGATKSEVPQ